MKLQNRKRLTENELTVIWVGGEDGEKGVAFVCFFKLPEQVLKMQTKLKFHLENDSFAYYY